MSRANLDNDDYFFRLAQSGYFVVSKDGIISNTTTGRVIGAGQTGDDHVRLRHKDSSGKMWNLQAHRLVWLVFKGRIEDSSLVINHIDSDKRNNALTNLELVTAKRNHAHRIEYDPSFLADRPISYVCKCGKSILSSKQKAGHMRWCK